MSSGPVLSNKFIAVGLSVGALLSFSFPAYATYKNNQALEAGEGEKEGGRLSRANHSKTVWEGLRATWGVYLERVCLGGLLGIQGGFWGGSTNSIQMPIYFH